MEQYKPTYDEALSLFREFNKNESLQQHAYAVEGVMRYIAIKSGLLELNRLYCNFP